MRLGLPIGKNLPTRLNQREIFALQDEAMLAVPVKLGGGWPTSGGVSGYHAGGGCRHKAGGLSRQLRLRVNKVIRLWAQGRGQCKISMPLGMRGRRVTHMRGHWDINIGRHVLCGSRGGLLGVPR